MNPLRRGMIWAVVACGAGCFCGRNAAAQSLGDPPSSTGAAGLGAASIGGQATPVPVPLFSPAVPSITANPMASALGSSAPSGIMSSPFAQPFLYSSMWQATQPLSTSSSTSTGTGRGMGMMNPGQLGLLMLATQQNPGAIGSGTLSGSRPGSNLRNTSAAGTAAASKRRTAARPGGLASRYFNRVNPHTTYPQSYFNRQPRYFP